LDEALAVGIDIGGTHTKIGLISASGRIIDYQSIPSDLQSNDPRPFLENANGVVEGFTWGYPVKGIGISLCSLINKDHNGALLSVNAPALNNLNIQTEFEDTFDLPVQVINDVNAYALAEANFGTAKEVERFLCLGLGTGLTIAALDHGRVLETWGGVSADAGRIVLEPEGKVMCKGRVRGSAEALCGTAYIESLAREKYGRVVQAREVIAASRHDQDPLANEIMAEIGEHAGHLLALLSPIFFPQMILITGGTAEAGEVLFTAIRRRYRALIGDYIESLFALESGEARPVQILKGALGPEAAMIGAVAGFLFPHSL
jgi:glucokinase